MSDYKDRQSEKKIQAIEASMKKAEADSTEESIEPRERVIQIAQPDNPMYCEEWQGIIKANYPSLLFAAELGASILAQILINDITNPFALVFVDVPSSGKTIVINFFAEIEDLTYASDKFSPASFVSNAANVKKSKLSKIDLLPRIQYTMFLIRDLATIFSKREDDLNELLGLLTRVLDGEGLNTDTGIHGKRKYVGEYLFMILAASTPISPRVWKMMGNLGSRLFFLNLNSKDKSDDELADQLGSTTHKDKEKLCQTATRQLLQTLWSQHPDGINWDSDKDDRELKLILARCARLLAHLRGVVNVWKERTDDGTETSHSIPNIEKPDRINQLFYNLCRGHAVISGRSQTSKEDLRYVIEIAIDSAPTTRTRLFRALLDQNGEIYTSQVEELLNCSKPTALKEMEALKILGLCSLSKDSQGLIGEPEKILKLRETFHWFLSDECKQLRGLTPKTAINKVNSTLCEANDQDSDDLKRVKAVFGPVQPVSIADIPTFKNDGDSPQEQL